MQHSLREHILYQVVAQLQQLLVIKSRSEAAKDVRVQHALEDRDRATARAERGTRGREGEVGRKGAEKGRGGGRGGGLQSWREGG